MFLELGDYEENVKIKWKDSIKNIIASVNKEKTILKYIWKFRFPYMKGTNQNLHYNANF